MKCVNKTSYEHKISDILRGNEGASIVLVTIIAVLIITGIVVLRVTTSTLWASADKQYNQDRAYVLATSMGSSLDALINKNSSVLTSCTNTNGTVIARDNDTRLPGGEVVAVVTPVMSETGIVNGYMLRVNADVAGATYVYTAYYVKSGSTGNYLRQII